MDTLNQDQRNYLMGRVNGIRSRLINKAHVDEARKSEGKKPAHLNWDRHFLEGRIKLKSKKQIAHMLKTYCLGHNPEGSSNFRIVDLFDGAAQLYHLWTYGNQPKPKITEGLQAIIDRINEECDRVLDSVMLPGSDAKAISAMLNSLNHFKW
jgi:hypothetical protein